MNAFKSIKKKPSFEFYEDIEILRFLSLNKKVLMVETKKNSIGVDDQKSLNLVRKSLVNNFLKYKTINSYKTILFDCDGVLINSNKFKYNLF